MDTVSEGNVAFRRSAASFILGAAMVVVLCLILWFFIYVNFVDMGQVAAGILFFAVPLAGLAAYARYTNIEYALGSERIVMRRAGREQAASWDAISSFSETSATHREGDRHCYLKDREGAALMPVAAHLLGRHGPTLIEDIRGRLGPPRLPEDGGPEMFIFRHFTGGALFHVELTAGEIAAVNNAGEIRIPLTAVEKVSIHAWPKIGAGLEKARIIGDGKMIEFDSRLVGFWPLMEYLIRGAAQAEVDDQSRRSQLRHESLSRPGTAPTAPEPAPEAPATSLPESPDSSET